MNARAPLYQARYGSAATPTPTAGSPVIDHLLAHRSVRAYLPDPVSDDTLTAIVAAAQSAASSSNLHAWSVVAVRDPARAVRLAREAVHEDDEDGSRAIYWRPRLPRSTGAPAPEPGGCGA